MAKEQWEHLNLMNLPLDSERHIRPYHSKTVGKKHRSQECFKPEETQPKPPYFPRRAVILSLSLPVVSLESRAMHLNTLVQEAQDRVNELSA